MHYYMLFKVDIVDQSFIVLRNGRTWMDIERRVQASAGVQSVEKYTLIDISDYGEF